MDMSKVPPAYEDVIDLRDQKKSQRDDRLVRRLRGENIPIDPAVDVYIEDKRLEGDPKGDIGVEMQPVMKGYGKAMQSRVNQWRVR